MRILRIFFTSIIMVVLVGGAVGLIAREILLYMAVLQVRSAVRELSSIQPTGEFDSNCLDYSTFLQAEEGLATTRAQLRFITPNQYVLELVCQHAESLRQTLRTDQLPPLVRKENGQSGLVKGALGGGVVLTVMGRSGAVYDEGGLVSTSLSYNPEKDPVVATGPETVCQGYGYTCCNDAYQTGQDLQNNQALDCPRSCYASCIDKPIILNFQTDPPADPNTRLVIVPSGTKMTFFYTVNDLAGDALSRAVLTAEPANSWIDQLASFIAKLLDSRTPSDRLAKIVISFGDGNNATVSDLQGTAEHTYTCRQTQCVYAASIWAETEQGIISSPGELSKLQVVVQE